RLLLDAVLSFGKIERYDVEHRTEGDLGCFDRGSGAVTGQAGAFFPHRAGERLDGVGARCEVAQHDDSGKGCGYDRSDQRVTQEVATPETGLFVADAETFSCCGARRLRASRAVTLFDEFVVLHEGLGPVDRANADGNERDGDSEP